MSNPKKAIAILLLGVLTAIWLVELADRMRQPDPGSPAVRKTLVLGERLGLAGRYCDELLPAVRSVLVWLALYVETDKQRETLLKGRKVSPSALPELTPGYRLLATYLMAPSPAMLQELKVRAYLGLLHLNICFVGLCLLLGAGIWMGCFGSRPRTQASPEPPARRMRVVWGAFLLWTMANIHLVPFLTSRLGPWGGTFQKLMLAHLLSYLLWGVVLLFKPRSRGEWKRPDGGWVGLAYLSSFFIITLLDQLMSFLGTEPPVSAGIARLLQDSNVLQASLLVILAVVLVPLMEELVFRVWLLGGLKSRVGSVWALIISSGCFALVHGQPAAFVQLFALGLILGSIYLRSGSLTSCVVAHGMWNLTSLLHLLAGLPIELPIHLAVRDTLMAVVMI